MFSLIINPLPLIFTLATTFGVLIHDTQLDRAATVAIALPAVVATYAAVDSAIKGGEAHLHVERVSAHQNMSAIRGLQPRLQPRDDSHRSTPAKKFALGAHENTSLWPSI